ncbi:hypothetical protein [Pseudofrankia saprophytica]|nr:hypothetical protein [Pseudofrankia saprophytica]
MLTLPPTTSATASGFADRPVLHLAVIGVVVIAVVVVLVVRRGRS